MDYLIDNTWFLTQPGSSLQDGTLEFLEGGDLRYSQVKTKGANKWVVIEDIIHISVNNGYVKAEVRIKDGKLTGTAKNIAGKVWKYEASPLEKGSSTNSPSTGNGVNQTIIEILIDASGSMGNSKTQLIEGYTRMSLVKKILLKDIIPTIDYASSITIRTFRTHVAKNGNDSISKNVQTPVIYSGEFDEHKIVNAISNLKDPEAGGTPITAAIKAAIKHLEHYPDSDRKIILLTDGQENGGGDYKKAAKEANSLKGIACKIFIVGIAQDKEAEAKTKEIATGGYINLKSSVFSSNEVSQALTPLKEKVLWDSISNVQQATIPEKPLNIGPMNQQEKPIPTETPIKSKVESTVDKLNTKIQTLKNANKASDFPQRLTNIEEKLKTQILHNQLLLEELLALKQQMLINLPEYGIDATTLTIDEDYSEDIRKKSEAYLNAYLIAEFGADKVIWLNKDKESNLPYDFELLNKNGDVVNIIECKGTPRRKSTFYITDSEWSYFLRNKEIYQVYRIYDVEGEMSHICLENLFDWLISGKVVPYLTSPEILKERRVFLTLI